jgi:hypothetical protein
VAERRSRACLLVVIFKRRRTSDDGGLLAMLRAFVQHSLTRADKHLQMSSTSQGSGHAEMDGKWGTNMEADLALALDVV